MTKLTRIIALMMGAVCLYSTSVKAATCNKEQYLVGNACKACPANATCNGKTAKCNPGYQDIAKNIHEAVCKKVGPVCKKNQYPDNNGKCLACPNKGICDGDKVSCKTGTRMKVDKKGVVTCISEKK